MLTLGKWAFALSSTIFKIWKPFPENPIRQLIANGHPKPYTKQYKAWVQKNTFWHPPYSSANKYQTSKTLWHLPHFSTSILSFYRPDFCLFRLQLCTSWSSPISATTSTFVLVILWTRLSSFSLCMHNICPFGLQLLQCSLLLHLSQLLALQCLRFVQLSALSLLLWLSFPFDYSASHFFRVC